MSRFLLSALTVTGGLWVFAFSTSSFAAAVEAAFVVLLGLVLVIWPSQVGAVRGRRWPQPFARISCRPNTSLVL